jgi:hypothetical protein
MGFLGGIGKAIGGIAKTVGGIAGKVADFGGKALSIIQKPMDALTAPIKNLAGGLLDKLPFGLGKIAKPFVDKLIDSGASFLAGGPLGGLGFLGGEDDSGRGEDRRDREGRGGQGGRVHQQPDGPGQLPEHHRPRSGGAHPVIPRRWRKAV